MNKNNNILRNSILSIIVFALISLHGFSQSDYKSCIKNIKIVDANTVEFDVYLESVNDFKLTSFQGGVTFNYDAIANGGIITGEYKAGSADKTLPKQQQSPKWTLNATSKQIRLTASIVPDSIAVSIPASPGVRLGTFVMKNTVTFVQDVIPDFKWSFARGSGTTTTTLVTAYVNGAKMPANITKPESHCVEK